MGREIERAIAETERDVRLVQRATRHRRDWNFVREEVLREQAETSTGTAFPAAEELYPFARSYFQAREDATVVFGADLTGAKLFAVWVAEGAPTYDPPWDGLAPAQRAEIERLQEEANTIDMPVDTDEKA